MFKRMILWLSAVLLLAACGTGTTEAPASGGTNGPLTIATDGRMITTDGPAVPRAGDVAPDFRFTMPDGSTRKLSDLRGKKVLINFWATWCEPCREEMPDLQRLAQEQGESLVILGVNKLELPDVMVPFARELGVTFTLVANPEGDIATAYAAVNIPISLFVNSDGTIGYRKLGLMNYVFMRDQVAALK